MPIPDMAWPPCKHEHSPLQSYPHLICHEHDVLVGSELDQLLQILGAQALACMRQIADEDNAHHQSPTVAVRCGLIGQAWQAVGGHAVDKVVGMDQKTRSV